MTVPRIDVDRLSVANVFFFFDDKNGKEKISISHLEERNIIIINIVNISDKYI